jgi:hypothetical protein
MPEKEISILMSGLARVEAQLVAIKDRLDSGSDTMKDHEIRIRDNTTDINGIAQTGRDISVHLSELKEVLDGVQPFTTFLKGFAKLTAWAAALYTVYQFIPKSKV